VAWLDNETDYFTCPSSINLHGNHPEGLLIHSVNVLEFALHIFNLLVKKKPEYEYLRESVIIASLFHDVCKTNQYKITEKWTKDDNNKWVSYNGYEVDDKFPFGHGEKSVYLISQYIKLTQAEALAIRWHMGNSEVSTMIGMPKFSYEKAYEQPLVVLIQAADLMAVKIEDAIDYKNLAK
jgi:hypothetical protein